MSFGGRNQEIIECVAFIRSGASVSAPPLAFRRVCDLDDRGG
jgi:hypothetical protein